MTVIMVALQQGMYPVAIMTASLAGAIIGFIRYNFNPATIFMGDTGSLFLGYIVGGHLNLWRLSRVQRPLHFWSLPLPWGFPLWIRPLPFCVAIKMAGPFFSPTKVTSTIGSLLWALVSVRLLFSCISSVQGFALPPYCLQKWTGFMPCPSGVLITIIFIGAKKIGILKDR